MSTLPSASRIYEIRDITDLRTAACTAWRAGNNAGDGYSPGDDYDPAAPREGWELIDLATADDQVDVWRVGDDVVLVGDAHGPWAVRVRS